MGSKKNVDMSATQDTIKIVANPDEVVEETMVDAEGEVITATEVNADGEIVEAAAPTKARRTGRSARYAARRSQVDKTKKYDPFAAVEMVKRLSYGKFTGSMEAHGVVREEGTKVDLTYPHSTGQAVRVAIVSDDVLKEIEAGTINFEVLIARPSDMAKLTKLARVLGPRGLMPNPKNGTLTDNPEAKKKDFESGKISIKAEKKAPLFHTVIGKTDMETKALVENLETLIKAWGGQLVRLSICATMSPSVKVMVE